MKKIAFIIPYFGKLRKDFPFWMKSIELNPSIDVLLFTDQTCILPPEHKNNQKNIHRI